MRAHFTDAVNVRIRLACLEQLRCLDQRFHDFEGTAVVESLVPQPLFDLTQVEAAFHSKLTNCITKRRNLCYFPRKIIASEILFHETQFRVHQNNDITRSFQTNFVHQCMQASFLWTIGDEQLFLLRHNFKKYIHRVTAYLRFTITLNMSLKHLPGAILCKSANTVNTYRICIPFIQWHMSFLRRRLFKAHEHTK